MKSFIERRNVRTRPVHIESKYLFFYQILGDEKDSSRLLVYGRSRIGETYVSSCHVFANEFHFLHDYLTGDSQIFPLKEICAKRI